MTDPFVPTGRELDEGVTGPGLERDKVARPGLFRRLFGRGSKHVGKNLTEVQLDVPDAVGIKPPGVRVRPPSEPPDAPPSTGPDAAAKPAGTSAKTARVRAANKAARTVPLGASFVPAMDLVASIVTLSRSPGGVASRICVTYLKSGTDSQGNGDLIDWWLRCEGTDFPHFPATLEAILPTEARELPGGIGSVASRSSLANYQRLCAVWDRQDVAVKELGRKARSYPSLGPLVASLKVGDLNAAKGCIDYDSAAWHECRAAISEAITALDAAVNSIGRPLMIKMPRSANDLPLIQRAVLSTLCIPSSISPLRSTCKDILKGASIPDSAADVSAMVARLLRA